MANKNYYRKIAAENKSSIFFMVMLTICLVLIFTSDWCLSIVSQLLGIDKNKAAEKAAQNSNGSSGNTEGIGSTITSVKGKFNQKQQEAKQAVKSTMENISRNSVFYIRK